MKTRISVLIGIVIVTALFIARAQWVITEGVYSESFDTNGNWTLTSNGVVIFTHSASLGAITFGSTSTPPASGVSAKTWVTVQIFGDSNSYRMPLYK